MKYKPTLCLDFDGVIHSYTSGWKGIDIINDPIVPGAIHFIYDATEFFTVSIFSTRSSDPKGIQAMQNYIKDEAVKLITSGLFNDDPNLCFLSLIEYPTSKPPAFLSIDDRAIQFRGEWPSIKTMQEFKPWNK